MKTKTTESGKKSATGKPKNKKQTIDIKYELTEEEKRELAEILYHQRIEKGEYGTAGEYWYKAEGYLIYSEE